MSAAVATTTDAQSAAVLQAGERRSSRIESLRAVAALAVLLSHVYAYSHGWEPSAIYHGFLHRAIMGGGFGVQLFFALSGYLLYRAFAKRDFSDGKVDLGIYARNRILRILPLYYTVVIVLLLFTQQVGFASRFTLNGHTAGQWLRFLFFFEEFSNSTAQRVIDAPIWSVVVEVIFYITLPLLAWVLAKASRGSAARAVAILLVIGAASIALKQANPTPVNVWSYSFPATFYGFVPGMILAIADVTWRGRKPPALKGIAGNSDAWVLASCAVWALIFWRYRVGPGSPSKWVLLTVVASFLLVGAVVLPLDSKRLIRFLDWRPLALVGVASYSLYLWHVPVIEVVLRHAPHGFFGLLVVALPLSLAVAGVSYALVERTALQFRRRWATQSGDQTNGQKTTYDGPLSILLPSSVSRFLPNREAQNVVIIAVVALATRLIAILYTHHLRLSADPQDYNRLGRLVAAGHGFGHSLLSPSGGPTAFRAPLYPWFLGVVYKVTGNSITAARLVEALLGVGSVLLIFLICKRFWDTRIALAASAIAAVFPPLIIYSTSLLTETLFIPLELAALYCVLQTWTSPRSIKWWVLAGLAAGLGILDRPNGAVVVIGLAALAVWGGNRQAMKRRLAGVAVLGAAAAIVVLPWEVRTVSDFHEWVSVTTIDGYNLAGVYNSQAAHSSYPSRYAWRPPNVVPDLQPYFQDRRLNEATLGDKLWSSGTKWIKDHPAALPEAMFWNSFRMTEVSGTRVTTATMKEAGYGKTMAAVAMLSFWVLSLLAIVGFVSKAIRRAPIALWLTPVLLWLISAPFLGMTRIRAPIDPFLILAAGVGLVALADRFRPRPSADLDVEPEDERRVESLAGR